MAPYHGWLYGQGPDGIPYEIINQARLAAYLKSPALTLPNGLQISDVLDFGGCEAYAYDPPCGGGDAYLDFPGVVGNYLSVPDAAALDISSDITIIVDVAMDDWTPATTQTLLAKWTTASNLSYSLSLTTGGQLQFQWTTNGSTINTVTSAAGLGILNRGERRSLRVDMDVVNGTQRQVRFYTASTNASAYVQLGATSTGATTSIFSGSSNLTVGQQTTTTLPLAGKIFFAQVRSGISGNATVGGSAALTIDPSVITTKVQSSFAATTGQTVTINRSGMPGVLIELGPGAWQPVTYISPAIDEAPWYDPNRSESSDALGFFVEEWTGLDSGHVTRPVGRAGTYRSAVGGLSAAQRVMKLNVLLVGLSEKAVEYLFRWLEATLSDACAPGLQDSMYFRRFCPTGSDKGDGVGELREVGLSEGLTWESDPFDVGSKCYIRRVSFSLTAGDPCIYVNGTTAAVETLGENIATCFSTLLLSINRTPCRPTCNELNPTCRNIFTYNIAPLGAAAPIVSLVNQDDEYSLPVRLICYSNPNEIDVTASGTCGMPVEGEIYISPLPPWSTLTWDVAAREVTYTDHSTSVPVSGWAFVDANDPTLPRFFSVPCGIGHVVVEPASACLQLVNSVYYYSSIPLGTAPHYPTVSVAIQERLGCGA